MLNILFISIDDFRPELDVYGNEYGVSLVPVLRNETNQLREGALTYWGNSVSVRTRDYRLLSTWEGDAWTNTELYEMSWGPDASVNIAGKYSGIVTQLKYILQSPSVNH